MVGACRRTARGRRFRGALALLGSLGTVVAWTGVAQASVTYTVNTQSDNLPSASECAGVPGDCSLRQALDRARAGDTVVLPASPAPYAVVHEAIPVSGGVTIEGAGAAATTITGEGVDQAFNLLGGGPVAIDGLTITETHNDSGEDEAGAITGEASDDPLTLEGVTISDSNSPTGYGGAIEIGSSIVIAHSRLVDDSTTSGGGGAIDVLPTASSVNISDSVFAGDEVDSGDGGALILESTDSLSVVSSTFSGDTAGGGASGGAIQLDATTTSTISNSTFTGNAAGSGGAISSGGKQLALLNDTLAGNSAELGANLAALAGTTAANTIFASPGGGGADCSGKVTSKGHNLEDALPSKCGLSRELGDILGVSARLEPLANNSSQDPTAGGPPQTLAVAPSSPAVGGGDPSVCASLGAVDERGFPRPGIPGGVCDVGAFELLPAVPSTTALAASTSSSTAGQPVTLTATVASTRSLPGAVPEPGGAVEFRDGGASLGGAPVDSAGQATLSTSALALGGHAFTAIYSGDAVYSPSSSPGLAETVIAPTAAVPAPTLSGLTEARSTWREGTRLASISRARRPPVGTTFRFTLNTPAAVKFVFSQTVGGRRVAGRCVAQSRHNRRRRACGRTVVAGTMTFGGAHGGVNVVAFQGRLSTSRKLAPGSYTVAVSAESASGRSAERRLSFVIAKG